MNGSPQARPAGFNPREWLYGALIVLAFVAMRAFIVQPFNIPSGSMKQTLLIGDHILVSKFSYGFSRYSLPFAPIPFPGRILGSQPARGDVVVFRARIEDEMRDLIKRVVGLPGDSIQVAGGRLIINGIAVPRERLADWTGPDPCAPEGVVPRIVTVKRWRETLPNGVRYQTLDCKDNEPLDDTPVFTVPAGHYFMMGDNRDDSLDSRVPEPEGFGFVPFDALIGRAQIVFFSVKEGERAWAFWRWPWSVRWERSFTVVR